MISPYDHPSKTEQIVRSKTRRRRAAWPITIWVPGGVWVYDFIDYSLRPLLRLRATALALRVLRLRATALALRVGLALFTAAACRPCASIAPLIDYSLRPVGLAFAPLIDYSLRPVGLAFAPLIPGTLCGT